MSADRRGLRLVKSGERYDVPAAEPSATPEPQVTVISLLVALFIALVASGLSYGFFDWLPMWVHGAVLIGAFVLMLAFGRRMACSD